MTVSTSSTRVTLASTNARIDTLTTAMGDIVTMLGTITANLAQHATTGTVAQITSAPSKRVAKKSPAKATARKAAAPKTIVTIEAAQAAVAAGGDAWKIFVPSNTDGNAIPFGLVLRAEKAAVRANTPKATKPVVKATKAVAAVGTNASVYFGMSKSALIADNSKGANAELARRDAKRLAKTG